MGSRALQPLYRPRAERHHADSSMLQQATYTRRGLLSFGCTWKRSSAWHCVGHDHCTDNACLLATVRFGFSSALASRDLAVSSIPLQTRGWSSWKDSSSEKSPSLDLAATLMQPWRSEPGSKS